MEVNHVREYEDHTVRQLRVHMQDICCLLPSKVEEYINARLVSVGFDMTKDIQSYEDLLMQQMVFSQKLPKVEEEQTHEEDIPTE